MTPTTAAWIAVVAAAAITTVTALRGRPARLPARVPAQVPAGAAVSAPVSPSGSPSGSAARTETDENWHPHVSSGCGR